MKFEILMMLPAWDLDVLIIVGDLLYIVMLKERRGICNRDCNEIATAV
jgi:hypothetical protein